ncbi:hypothetical protein CVS40_8908 [Lucilia cuprina]|nr:hypothetical protein CVS40_8908 [Lucilia cuprina]
MKPLSQSNFRELPRGVEFYDAISKVSNVSGRERGGPLALTHPGLRRGAPFSIQVLFTEEVFKLWSKGDIRRCQRRTVSYRKIHFSLGHVIKDWGRVHFCLNLSILIYSPDMIVWPHPTIALHLKIHVFSKPAALVLIGQTTVIRNQDTSSKGKTFSYQLFMAQKHHLRFMLIRALDGIQIRCRPD